MQEVINKKKSTTTPDYFIFNDRIITDKKHISELFNDYFVNIGKTLSKKVPQAKQSAISYLKQSCNKTLFLRPTTTNELTCIIKDLKTNSSSGWDEISPRVVQFCHIPLLNL